MVKARRQRGKVRQRSVSNEVGSESTVCDRGWWRLRWHSGVRFKCASEVRT